MPIPQNLKREHMLKAIAEIDRDGYDPIYESHRYSLVIDHRHYPPKHVVRLANRIANGGNLDALTFFPYEANRLLRKLGFTVVNIAKEPSGPLERKESIIQIFVKLEQLLRQIEPNTYSKNLANLISDLEHNGKIPKHITMRMHTMRITRNKVAHESCSLTTAQRTAYQADWDTVQEWWREYRK
jgi:hypothetical protein